MGAGQQFDHFFQIGKSGRQFLVTRSKIGELLLRDLLRVESLRPVRPPRRPCRPDPFAAF